MTEIITRNNLVKIECGLRGVSDITVSTFYFPLNILLVCHNYLLQALDSSVPASQVHISTAGIRLVPLV